MKRKILTFAVLATVAVGGALSSKANAARFTVLAGSLNSTTCNTPVECSPVEGEPCTISGTQYFLNTPATGRCQTFLSLDPQN